MSSTLVFDFNKNSDISQWQIVDDGVMGGKSKGNFELDQKGHGHFYGEVSLENNGGFSSLRFPYSGKNIEPYNSIKLRVKGDGKRYQVRIKSSKSDYASYVGFIETSGNWETLSVKLKEMYPSFRGRKLDRPNFDHNSIEEFALLIANKKAESFSLTIDKIELH